MWALISVYDKTGVVALGKRLSVCGVTILSTGGTAEALRKAGCRVVDVAEYTGFPEVFDGRVKTLHPKIHAGILARGGAEDAAVLKTLGAEAIDLVVVNLYPFEANPSMEMIDIGGPAMLRAAAKNHERVTTVCDPSDYDRVAAAFEKGGVPENLRRELAGKVFARTAAYEASIADWLGGCASELRYGENPHQKACFKVSAEKRFWGEPLQGKPLSYNNIVDADAAWWLIREFRREKFACAVIKHTNPCGMAISGISLRDAFRKGLDCDSTSAFGGIVAFNREVDEETAGAMREIFLELILAPQFSSEARAVFGEKKNLRLLEIDLEKLPTESVRSAGGGLLVQDFDLPDENLDLWKTVTKKKPSAEDLRSLSFAWRVCKHVKSNAIVLSDAEKILGVGAGQTSRIDSVKIACGKAGGKAKACASDAFFPFADNIEVLADAGVTAIVQPGGSVRDEEIIAAADRRGIAMVFTGIRHFRH